MNTKVFFAVLFSCFDPHKQLILLKINFAYFFVRTVWIVRVMKFLLMLMLINPGDLNQMLKISAFEVSFNITTLQICFVKLYTLVQPLIIYNNIIILEITS